MTISSPTEDREEEEGWEDTSIQDSEYMVSQACSEIGIHGGDMLCKDDCRQGRIHPR